MARKLRITDNVLMQPVGIVNDPVVLKDFMSNTGVQPLVVKIAATHSGLITGNNTFYLPDKMRKGTDTWISQYPKPVLVHHESNQDAVGRIVRAEYMDLAPDQVTIFNDSTLRSTLSHFKAGKLTKKGELAFIKDVLVKSEVLKDKNYQGLGYIQLVAAITDPDAIQKIRDGRYLTGSVSASTDAAVCSVCESDWIVDGRCDHSPGEIYDGIPAFLIAGNFEYEEYSWVNRPADVHSKMLELVSDGKCERIDNTKTNDHSRKAENSISMSDKLSEDALKVNSHAARMMLISAHDSLHYQWDWKIYSAQRDASVASPSTAPSPDQTPPPKDIYDLHEQLHKEAKEQGIDGSLVLGALDSVLPKDLWPPMPAYGSSEDSKETNTMPGTDVKDEAENKEVPAPATPEETKEPKVVEPITDAAAERELPCPTCEEALAGAENATRDAVADATAKAAELTKLTDQLKVLRDEFREVYKNIVTLEDELIAAREELRQFKATRAVDMKRLSGVEVKDVKSEVASLMKLDDKQLDAQVVSVDIDKIIDKLNSGLANTNPEATVANPSAPAKDTALSEDELSMSKTVQDTYNYLLKNSGPVKAENYLARMKREGYIKD
jgi:hypothetical protein